MSIELGLGSETISTRHSGFAADRAFGNDIIISPNECTSARVRTFYEYWERLRGDRAMPKRQDVDPVEIWSLLPYVHLSEWHTDPDGIFFRIAGTEIVATAGHEYRCRWLSDFLHEKTDLDQIMALFYRVVATRVPIFGRTDGSTRRLGVEFFEWVICPLSEDGKTVTHFIGLEDYVSTRRYLGGFQQ